MSPLASFFIYRVVLQAPFAGGEGDLQGGLRGMLFGLWVGAIVIMMLENKLNEIGHRISNVTTIDWFHTLGDSVTITTGFILIAFVLLFRRAYIMLA